ncbi:MAG TPA: GNAT family N-acetyltransferase [Caulobacteraceae bacterium]
MIRLARPDEAALLPAIEHDSDQTMRDTPYAYIADMPWVAGDHYRQVVEDGTTWVATDDQDRPVGFAACGVKADGAIVYQLSVMRHAQKRGLGRALMRAAIDWARASGYPRLMLTTFADVPFNAPFYRSLGFEAVAQPSPTASLQHMLAHEAAMGHDPATRVGMALDLRATGAKRKPGGPRP